MMHVNPSAAADGQLIGFEQRESWTVKVVVKTPDSKVIEWKRKRNLIMDRGTTKKAVVFRGEEGMRGRLGLF